MIWEAIPFQTQHLFGWIATVDIDQTAAYYNEAPDACDCGNCRNFAAALDHMPTALRTALATIGVDPGTPSEIMHFMQSSNHRHLYHAYYPIVGRIVEESKADHFAGPDYDFWLEPDPGFYPIPTGFPRPAVQAVIRVWLPWSLDEPADEIPVPFTAAEIDQQDRDRLLNEEPAPVAEQDNPAWWQRLWTWITRQGG